MISGISEQGKEIGNGFKVLTNLIYYFDKLFWSHQFESFVMDKHGQKEKGKKNNSGVIFRLFKF